MHFFDLDGTLVDTYSATVEAYRLVGLTFDPVNWGLSADDWNCPPEVHSKKQQVFPSVISSMGVSTAWALDYWNGLVPNQRTLLTGASLPTVHAISVVAPDLELSKSRIFLGHNLENKIQVLRLACKVYKEVFYYEDQPHLANIFKNSCPSVKVIHP